MALQTKIALAVVASLTNTLDLAEASVPLNLQSTLRLATGTGTNQADKIFHDRRTLAASGTEDLDLAGVLADPLGVTLTFARIKALIVLASSGNTNNVNITRPASNGVPLFLAAGDGIGVRPGGLFCWACADATGVAVTGGTGDLVTLTNSAGSTSVTFDVVIVGASA